MTELGQERRISAVCNISTSLLKADVEPTFDYRGFVPDSNMAGVKPFAYSRRPVQWLAVRSLRREIW